METAKNQPAHHLDQMHIKATQYMADVSSQYLCVKYSYRMGPF